MSEKQQKSEPELFAEYLTKRMDEKLLSIHQLSSQSKVSRNAVKAARKGESKTRPGTMARLLVELDGKLENGDPDLSGFKAYIELREAEIDGHSGGSSVSDSDESQMDHSIIESTVSSEANSEQRTVVTQEKQVTKEPDNPDQIEILDSDVLSKDVQEPTRASIDDPAEFEKPFNLLPVDGKPPRSMRRLLFLLALAIALVIGAFSGYMGRDQAPDTTSDASISDSESEKVTTVALIDNAEQVFVDPAFPNLAIVLLDEGESEIDVEALQTFPHPLTIAVDADLLDAKTRMQAYRDAGYEVAIYTELSFSSDAGLVEADLASIKLRIPQAIAWIDGGANVTRETARIFADSLKETGHGLIAFHRGLDTLKNVAEEQGVNVAMIFREIDDQGESSSQVVRFLDFAAFKASQEGQITLLGRMRTETLEALRSWSSSPRSQSLNIVPASVVLGRDG